MTTNVLTRPLNFLDAQGRTIYDSVNYTAFRGEYSGTNLIYAGFARPGASENSAVWQIFKMAYDGSGNVLSITWPQSSSIASSEFEFVWADRATYTYS